jgi:hypothetical protein
VNLSRIGVQYAEVTVTATGPDGTPTDLPGVDIALLPPHHKPTDVTTWNAADYTDGVARVLLAGPDTDPPEGAIAVPPGGADLWLRVVDVPEVQAVRADRILIT